MTRVSMITAAALAGCILGASATAFAQTNLDALRERNYILQQQDIARQNSLAAQREQLAAQSHYDAQVALRDLAQAAAPVTRPSQPTLRPALAAPPRGAGVDAMAADLEQMDRLTDQALAAGNARLRAIKPAS